MKITKDAMYPRLDDTWTIYLKNAITNPAISVGDYTMYHDFVHGPREFEKHNVLYQYPINGDRLKIGKILLHCLRGKVPVQQCQSCFGFPVHLSISHICRCLGAGLEAGYRGMGQQRRYYHRQ